MEQNKEPKQERKYYTAGEGKPPIFIQSIIAEQRKLKANLEFEAILSVPMRAWARRHGKDIDEYPYMSKVSLETGSNEAGWEEN